MVLFYTTIAFAMQLYRQFYSSLLVLPYYWLSYINSHTRSPYRGSDRRCLMFHPLANNKKMFSNL